MGWSPDRQSQLHTPCSQHEPDRRLNRPPQPPIPASTGWGPFHAGPREWSGRPFGEPQLTLAEVGKPGSCAPSALFA